MAQSLTSPKPSPARLPESQIEKTHWPLPRKPIGFRAALGRVESQDWCGRGGIIGVSPDNSQVMLIPVRCKSWDCPICGPRKRARAVARIADAHPNKFITLTLRRAEGVTNATLLTVAKAAWPKLVKRIRRTFGSFEYALVWELTKSGAPHVHVSAVSPYIPQRWLARSWRELTGSPIVDIRKVANPKRVAKYVGKYMLKNPYATTALLDGTRLIQFSKGYVSQEPPWIPATDFTGWQWTWVSHDVEDVMQSMSPDIFAYQVTCDELGTVAFRIPPGEAPPPILEIDLPDGPLTFGELSDLVIEADPIGVQLEFDW